MTDGLVRTTIEYWQTGDGEWKATEPRTDHDLLGRGANPAQAVANYGELLDETAYADSAGPEVPADD